MSGHINCVAAVASTALDIQAVEVLEIDVVPSLVELLDNQGLETGSGQLHPNPGNSSGRESSASDTEKILPTLAIDIQMCN